MKIKYCLICIFLFATFLIRAQQPNYILQAEEKTNAGLFTEASVLYERMLFDASSEDLLNQAITGKINCLKKAGLFAEAATFIKANINSIGLDSNRYKYYEQWILCTYLANQLEQSIFLIEQTQLLYPSLANKQWLGLFKILCLNEQDKWAEASQMYQQWVKDAGMDSTAATNIYATIPKLKSENKAAWLSTFIPGGGQLYAGKPWEALAALMIQGAGIYYGIVNFQEKYYLSAILVGGGAFGSFHNGGVRRSEELVKQYNKRVANTFNEKAKSQLIQQMKQMLEQKK